MTATQSKDFMEAYAVASGRGWRWIVDGFGLFRKNPIIWIVLTVALFAIAIGLGVIPVLGPLVFYLLSPIFLAGLMLGCRALEKGDEIEIAHLFAGFRVNASRLITIGGIYLIGQIVIYGVLVVIGGSAITAMMGGAAGADIATMPEAMSAMMMALMVALALSVPLMMAIWFAPLLVVFDNAPALAAVKLSFSACLKNLLPFTIYGLAMFVLSIAAAIPFGLGLLILIPTIFGSIYASYKDAFAVSEPGGQLLIGDSELP